MNQADQVQIHERVTRLEEKQSNTFDMIKSLTEVVAKQGKMMTRAIIVFIALFFAGIISNGGTEAVVNMLKNMSNFLL